MNLKHHILLLILILSIIPTFILCSILKENDESQMHSLIEQKLKFETENSIEHIDNYLNNFNRTLDIFCQNIETEGIQFEYNNLVALYPEINDVIITSNNSQKFSLNQNDNTKLIENLLINKSIKTKDGITQFFSYGNAYNKACFAIVKDLDDSKFENGKLILVVDLSGIQSFGFKDNEYKYKRSLMDFKGNVTDFPYVSVAKSYSDGVSEEISDYLNEVILQNYNDSNIFEKEFETSNIILSKCEDNNFYVYTIYDRDNIIAKDLNKMLSYVYLIIILLASIVIIAILYSDHITEPINSMLYYITNRKDGDNLAERKLSAIKDFEKLSNAYVELITELSNNEQKYRTIVEMSDNIVFEYNIVKNKVSFSDNFKKKFAFRAKSMKYEDSFFEKGPVYPDDTQRFKDILKKGFKDANYIFGEYRFLDIYNEYVWYLLRATLLYDGHGNKQKVIGCLFDVNNAKKSELALIERAKYDSLTNLLNRETLLQRLEKEVELSVIRKNYDAILFIDIDDFKYYNDNYNHSVGDEVLSFIGNILKDEVKDIGFAGRYGGDEFIVCLNTQSPFELAPTFAETIIKKFDEGFYSHLAKKQFKVRCSIGISFFSKNSKDIKKVIKDADEAMYRVKKSGKSNYSLYLDSLSNIV